MLAAFEGRYGVGRRQVIVLVFALGAALSVSAPASSLKLISAETWAVDGQPPTAAAADAGEARRAADYIRTAIETEEQALVKLRAGRPQGALLKIEQSRKALAVAAAFTPVADDVGHAAHDDEGAGEYTKGQYITNEDLKRAIDQISTALDYKRNALAVAEADVAAHSIPPATAKSGECRGFDPDQVVKGMGEETIAVDECDRVQIEVEDGTQPLTGTWGAKTASGFAAGSCGHVGVMLECTTPAGASDAVVVFGSPLEPGTEAKIVLKLADGLKQTLAYRVPNAAAKPPTTTTAPPPAGKIVKLEVGLTCGGVISAPIVVTNPTSTKPVIYVAQFKPHGFCGSNSQYLVDPATGKKLPDGTVIFPPNTTVYADQYECSQHPELEGCAGQGPDSQVFVFGLTVSNPRP
jgi:hypothetical protein